jgi:hydroxymethylbilane synthase
MSPLVIATRKSPLALAQSRLVAARLRAVLGVDTRLLELVTTGDRQAEWILSKQGGKGLFTGELEQALQSGEAHCAVHSAKDLPGEMAAGLQVVGYLPRADAHDVLVMREEVSTPKLLATGSPRRRLQLARLFPDCRFAELRGNVDTRLRKVAQGDADGTVLASAGLARLGIASWPGLTFRQLSLREMVPAVGQAAIAVQCRARETRRFIGAFDPAAARHLALERALQSALGAGCYTAFGAHATDETLYLFHQDTGFCQLSLSPAHLTNPEGTATRLIEDFGWLARSV